MLNGMTAWAAEMELTWMSASRWYCRTDLRQLSNLLLMEG